MATYLFNKPSGCVTARRDPRHKTVMDYFPEEMRDVFFPIGRLDRDTEGMLLVTDDGGLCYSLMEPKHHVTKKYFFHAMGSITPEKAKEIENGLLIFPDAPTRVTFPAKFELISTGKLADVANLFDDDERIRIANTRRGELPIFTARLTITEGKKHQVKRMIKAVGAHIVYLRREAIGGLALDETLAKGEYRLLSDAEIDLLRKSPDKP